MSKARELAELGDALTVDGSGNIDVTGTVTATSLAGDGSALTGIPLPPSQTTATWEAGTDTTESVVSAAKVAAAVVALAPPDAGGTNTVLLQEVEITTTGVSVVEFTSFYDAAKYEKYLVEFDGLTGSSVFGEFYVRVSSDGGTSFDGGTNYNNDLSTSMQVAGAGSGNGGLSMHLWMFNATDATKWTMFFGNGVRASSAGNPILSQTIGVGHNVADIVNALQIYTDTGEWAIGGFIRVHGVAKSEIV